MDDLSTLKGIGAATAAKLVAAGIDTFAKLAAATPDALNVAKVAGSPKDWAAMIAEAKAKLLPPTDLLNGSSTLPATFEIGGDAVQLGTLVAAAHQLRGGTAEEWNALPEAERDALIVAERDRRLDAVRAAAEDERSERGHRARSEMDQAMMARVNALAKTMGLSLAEAGEQVLVAGLEALEARVAAAANSTEPPAKGMIEVKVRGPKSGRRRAGRDFNDQPAPPFWATPEEVAALEADPSLTVVRTGRIAD